MRCSLLLLILSANILPSLVFAQTNRQPVFSDQERRNMPKNRPFHFSWIMKDGLLVPRINGRGLWGTAGLFSNQPPRQAYYEAAIMTQQGWNNVRLSIRPEDGYNLDDWTKSVRAFDQQGIASLWLGYAMVNRYAERILGLEEGSLGDTDRVTREDGDRKHAFRGAGVFGNPWNPAFLKNSEKMLDRITQVLDFKSVVGYQITNETVLENGSFDPYARRSWQQFLKNLFVDDTPAADTNGDGAWYNKAYAREFKSWNEVEMFKVDDLKDPAKNLLKDLWVGASYASYVQRMAEVIHKRNPDAMTGASVCVPASAQVDLSYLVSMPDVNVAFTNTYGCWLGGGLMMAAIANTYGKPAVASEINYPAGGYKEMKWTALTMLPYLEGFQWFGYNQKDGTEPDPDEMNSEYGGKYGLIDHGMIGHFDGDGDPSYAGDVCKATLYDPRFAVIPQLAPFPGRLNSGIDKSILWITASGYRPDYEEDHQESQLFRAHVTSDMAVTLKPDALSLDDKKVVIYRNIESPCISRNIYRKLTGYVRSGGTVVTGAYYIGKGKTILGEDNSACWWKGLKPVRESFTTDGNTVIEFNGNTLQVSGTHQYLTADSTQVETDGEVADSTGASYPLVFIRKEGKGKWVLINYPMIFRLSERENGWQPDKFDARFRLLREIVEKHAGVKLPYRYEMQVYTGDGCALAIKEPEPSGVPAVPPSRPKLKASTPAAVFEIFEKKLYGGPFLKPSKGYIEIPEAVKSGEARLWIVKPYGRPVVLYADGTEKNAAKIDDGVYRSGRLTFTFAEQAYISSPTRPKSVEAGGKQLEYSYNESNQVLHIQREGSPVQAVVTY